MATPTIPATPTTPASSIGNSLKNAWTGFFADLKSDPNKQAALLQFAAQVSQPIQPNQTFSGNLGKAIGESSTYLQQLRGAQSQGIAAKAKADADRAATTKIAGNTLKENARQFNEKAPLRSSEIALNQANAIGAKAGDAKLPASEVQVLKTEAKARLVAAGLGTDEKNLNIVMNQILVERRTAKAETDRIKLQTTLAGSSNRLPGQEVPNVTGVQVPGVSEQNQSVRDLITPPPPPPQESFPKIDAFSAEVKTANGYVTVQVVGKDEHYFYVEDPVNPGQAVAIPIKDKNLR